MADEHSSYERLLDAFVHAPIGFALYARDTAPGFARLFVARGREELQRRRRGVDDTVTQAKAVGRFAVSYGPPEIKRRVEGVLSGLRPDEPGPEAPVSAPRSAGRVGRPAAPPAPNVTTPPPASPLPIPDYDALSASQVVERLDGLGPEDLGAIASYEASRRGRRTILGKIEQLTA